jgi:hypothetical protein
MTQMNISRLDHGVAGPAGSGPSAEGRHRSLPLPGSSGSIGLGRDFTRQVLDDREWSAGAGPPAWTVAADAVLIVSELLTNAVLHVGGPIELELDSTDTALRIAVTDSDPTPPTPRPEHQPGLPGGHGLYMIEQLSDRWGVVVRDDGKTVWAELDATQPAALLASPPGAGV